MSTDSINILLNDIKKTAKNGGEYWMGKDLQPILGYATWENFDKVIKKAKMACESTGEKSENHFRETTSMVEIGSGAMREEANYFLDRYACYLIAMNGDSSKPEIGLAQTYFAIQTRRQEISDENLLSDTQKRIELRDRVKDATKHLGSAAKAAGVQHALFHDAGYRGLYGMGLRDIKKKKGLSEKESLFDRAGRAELAANEFRATQTEQVLKRDQIKGEQAARNTHHRVGLEVRKTIANLGGTMPEDLQSEPSIKKLASKSSKKIQINSQVEDSN
jgi:DNA-damage-inducible protein D